ncbi:hypothetical protein Cni_G10317 [Canna indica]|uniref:Uncharacterized protein n=1 Tax=Canna indica TaxID=4628 RepID=A0AAQ3K493_9LILI|nr:hypothetical protein Cni_G10317 [Canna indica]
MADPDPVQDFYVSDTKSSSMELVGLSTYRASLPPISPRPTSSSPACANPAHSPRILGSQVWPSTRRSSWSSTCWGCRSSALTSSQGDDPLLGECGGFSHHHLWELQHPQSEVGQGPGTTKKG